MSFPRYPAYKDSGVAWLGEVPKHWQVAPLKAFIDCIESGVSVNATDTPAEGEQFGVLKTSCVYTGQFDAAENKAVVNAEYDRVGCPVVANTLIVSRMNTPDLVGAAGLTKADHPTLFLPDRLWQVFPKDTRADFMHFWTRTASYRAQVEMACAGTSSSMQNLGQDDFRSFMFVSPPPDEQAGIASFLDRETAKIDALVAEQEQLITLLKEKRQAVISHAVTKGLDPSVPMKDSGVEWLGEVPEHWGIGKVKQFFATTSGSTPNTDRQDVYYNGEIPWIRSLDLTDGDIVEWEIGITPAAIDDTACKLLPVGTVLVAMYGGDGTIGKNGLLRIPAATNQAICALLPSSQFEPEFVLAFMQHQRPYWMVGAEGTRKDPNISQDRVRNALIPCPPLSEQRVIVEHVKQALSAFGSLEKEAEAVIGILNERRSALISAAVTGQIDVRGLAPAQEQAA